MQQDSANVDLIISSVFRLAAVVLLHVAINPLNVVEESDTEDEL